MKKLILLGLLALIGCQPIEKKPFKPHVAKINDGYHIWIIDSCEYLRVNDCFGFAHKGNCRFCAERQCKMYQHLTPKN